MNDAQLSSQVGVGYAELPISAQIPVVTWFGATGAQLWCNFEAPIDYAAVRRELEDGGLPVRSMHAPYGSAYDLSSPDDKAWAAAITGLIPFLDTTASLGGSFLVVHASPGPIKGLGRKARQERGRRLGDGLVRLTREAAQRGVRLALENSWNHELGCDAADLLAIVQRVASPALGICFDTGHANLAGRPVKMLRSALPGVITLHIHDNDGKGDLHREPLSGTIDWPGLRQALVDADYQGDVTVECLEAVVALHRRNDLGWRDQFREWWTGA